MSWAALAVYNTSMYIASPLCGLYAVYCHKSVTPSSVDIKDLVVDV